MGFMNFGKKKNVPDELPELISDEIEKESLDEINSALKDGKEEEVKKEEPKKEEPTKEEVDSKRATDKNVVNRLIRGVEDTPMREIKKVVSDKSFFSDLQEKIVDEMDDVESLESWYNQKINSGDIVNKMKSYWNSQKKASVLDIMANNFKEKIAGKVSELQELEKEWQSVYFELIEKEEKIKEAEAGLKEMVSEFMVICKDKKKALEKNHFEESISSDVEDLSQSKNVGNVKKKKKHKKKKKQSIVNGGENVEEKQKESKKN